MTGKARQKGLTLIEVLVALAVLSAVVGSILVLIGQHARQAAALEDRMLARIVAENAMTEAAAAQEENRSFRRRDEVELSGRVFVWELDLAPAPLEGYELQTVGVRLGRDGQELASLSTLKAAGAQ